MPKSLETIESHVSDILENRRKTKDARFKLLAANVERVDDVLRQAVGYLAERLADKGFKPALSKLSLSRKLRELTQTITLERSVGNLSGVSVGVGVHVSVTSANYRRWRGSEGTGYASKYLWIRQLGDLAGRREYLRWQLVDPSGRQAELESLLGSITALALPVFDAWGSKQSISTAVFRMTELTRIDWLMEVALWVGNRGAAAQLLNQHLQTRPQDVVEYKNALLRCMAGQERTHYAPIREAAFLVARHGLHVTVD